MKECAIELQAATRRCHEALTYWGLDAGERQQVLSCGVSADEPGGPVALETRMRHVVDVDRSIALLVGSAALLGVWLRLSQDALGGLTPLELITAHPAGLRHLRQLLIRERLERGFN